MKKWQFNPYKARPIQFLQLHAQGDWKIKMYSISSKQPVVSSAHIERAKALLAEVLPSGASDAEQYGIAFSIIHEGNDGNYVLVSWWTGENMLRHYVYADTPDQPHVYKNFSQTTGIVSCVWELEILYFEKKAWSKTVLLNNEKPAFEEYLSLTYSGTV